MKLSALAVAVLASVTGNMAIAVENTTNVNQAVGSETKVTANATENKNEVANNTDFFSDEEIAEISAHYFKDRTKPSIKKRELYNEAISDKYIMELGYSHNTDEAVLDDIKIEDLFPNENLAKEKKEGNEKSANDKTIDKEQAKESADSVNKLNAEDKIEQKNVSSQETKVEETVAKVTEKELVAEKDNSSKEAKVEDKAKTEESVAKVTEKESVAENDNISQEAKVEEKTKATEKEPVADKDNSSKEAKVEDKAKTEETLAKAIEKKPVVDKDNSSKEAKVEDKAKSEETVAKATEKEPVADKDNSSQEAKVEETVAKVTEKEPVADKDNASKQAKVEEKAKNEEVEAKASEKDQVLEKDDSSKELKVTDKTKQEEPTTKATDTKLVEGKNNSTEQANVEKEVKSKDTSIDVIPSTEDKTTKPSERLNTYHENNIFNEDALQFSVEILHDEINDNIEIPTDVVTRASSQQVDDYVPSEDNQSTENGVSSETISDEKVAATILEKVENSKDSENQANAEGNNANVETLENNKTLISNDTKVDKETPSETVTTENNKELVKDNNNEDTSNVNSKNSVNEVSNNSSTNSSAPSLKADNVAASNDKVVSEKNSSQNLETSNEKKDISDAKEVENSEAKDSTQEKNATPEEQPKLTEKDVEDLFPLPPEPALAECEKEPEKSVQSLYKVTKGDGLETILNKNLTEEMKNAGISRGQLAAAIFRRNFASFSHVSPVFPFIERELIIPSNAEILNESPATYQLLLSEKGNKFTADSFPLTVKASKCRDAEKAYKSAKLQWDNKVLEVKKKLGRNILLNITVNRYIYKCRVFIK